MSPAGLKVSAVLRSTDITADARGFGHEVFGKFPPFKSLVWKDCGKHFLCYNKRGQYIVSCPFLLTFHHVSTVIWSVVKPMIDEDTLKKIYILRGQQEIFTAMLERIPIENIPAEYGGKSVPLGQSPEDQLLKQLMYHNNALANKEQNVCAGTQGGCQFCHFQIARSY